MFVDHELIGTYLVTVFGEGTQGDVPVCSDSGAEIISRDFEEIGSFVEDHPDAFTALATYGGAAIKEVAGIGTGFELDEHPENVLPPSIVLRKGDKRFAIWLLDEPVLPADVSHCEVLDRVNKVLNGSDAMLTDAVPLAGVGGWEIDAPVLGAGTPRYSVQQMANAILKQSESTWAASALEAAEIRAPQQEPKADPAPGTTRHNDAKVYGIPDPGVLARAIEIGLSRNGAKTKPGTWKNWRTKIADLVDLLSKHPVGKKDGPCILQGKVIDGERRANAIEKLDLLILDLDTGDSIDKIHAKLQSNGLFGIIWTTHSHLKTTSQIKKDTLVKFASTDNPTVADAVKYLLEEKSYRPYILEGAELLDTEHTKEPDGISSIAR